MSKRKDLYKRIYSLEVEATCVGISKYEWDKYMKDAVVANKRKINSLVSIFLPQLYRDLSLNLRNPYKYYMTNTHLILVHSGIEHFIRYEHRNK